MVIWVARSKCLAEVENWVKLLTTIWRMQPPAEEQKVPGAPGEDCLVKEELGLAAV